MPVPRWRRDGGGDAGGRGSPHHDGGGPARWLLTYADMITLLMAFFIMMYSISVLDSEKFRTAAASLRREFGEGQVGHRGRFILAGGAAPSAVVTIVPLTDPSPQGGRRTRPARAGALPPVSFRGLQDYLREKNLSDLVRLRAEKRGLVITLLADGLLFPAGSAEITGPCRGVLDRLASAIKGVPNEVSVEGHTCDLPPRGRIYPSNWELSTARATQVIRYFVEVQHIPARRLSAAGYASSKPLAPNNTDRSRALNRRVDIVIQGRYSL